MRIEAKTHLRIRREASSENAGAFQFWISYRGRCPHRPTSANLHLTSTNRFTAGLMRASPLKHERRISAGEQSRSPTDNQRQHAKKPAYNVRWFSVLALPIFPASHPASIVGGIELNFCVRYGNRWTLNPINTNYSIRCTLKTEHHKELAKEMAKHLSLRVSQALGLLVSVSCTRYRASTSDLSTS